MANRRFALIPTLGAVAVLAHHLAWYGTFPQYQAYPPDQAGYVAGGRALAAVLAALLQKGPTPELIEEVRRWFDFLGVAALYGAIDWLRPNDLDFARLVFACFNALAAIGVYSLARRLGSPRAGVLALILFAVSPAFPSGASRLYGDAVTGCLLVWGVRLFVAGGRGAFLAGLLAGVAMLIRVQLLPWVPLGLSGFTIAAWALRAKGDTRRLIRLGWLGLSLPLLVFVLLTYFGLENRHDSIPKHNLPRYHYYPYGFWQYLESDGWDGPFRLKQDPFYLELLKAEESDPRLSNSRARQYLFAGRYVAARLDKAIPIYLGNFSRIFSRPQNPEHRGFIPDDASVLIHRVALMGAVVAMVRLWTLGSPGFLAAILILTLGAFHAGAYGWPRYAMPVLPVLLALSGVGLEIVVVAIRTRFRFAMMLVGLLLLAFGLAWLLGDQAPEAAGAIRLLALVGGLAAVLPLSLNTAEPSSSRASVAMAMALLGAMVFGNAWRDASWHQVDLNIRRGDVVRQVIRLDQTSIDRIRSSRDPVLGVDLELNHPSFRPWPIRINGVPATLAPTIPPLPESIPVALEGRAYPQWWTVSLTKEMLDAVSADGRVVADVTIDDPGKARLKADRFRDQATVFEAPSLGDWPFAAGLKPEYDRDFRLVERTPLQSLETRTSLLRNGETLEVRAAARIRVFELDDRSGYVTFELDRMGSSDSTAPEVLGFAARATMRDRGEAELMVAGVKAASFRIATFRNDLWTSGTFSLCYRDRTPNSGDDWESRGLYLLSGPLPCAGKRCEATVRFWPGLDDRPMSFGPELPKNQPTAEDLSAAARECGFSGPVQWSFGRLIDGTANSYPADRGRWHVARIY